MIFSQNQVTQAYVAKAVKSTIVDNTGSIVSNLVLGDTHVGVNTKKDHFYIQHFGQGGLTRSDLIDPNKVLSVSSVSAVKMQKPLCIHKVELASNVNGGVPIPAEDYVLRIDFRPFPTWSEENVYSKDFAVHVFGAMTASAFYAKMAIQAVKSFARESVPLVKIYLESDGEAATNGLKTLTEVTKYSKESGLTGTYISLVFETVEQPWRRGVMESYKINFTLSPTTVEFGGDEVIWGKTDTYDHATNETSAGLKNTKVIKNTHLAADYEFFTMKNRADQYGTVGYPDNLETAYMVDLTKEYDFINIHYFTDESGVDVQKSEKDLVLMVEAGTSADLIAALNAVLPATKQIPAIV